MNNLKKLSFFLNKTEYYRISIYFFFIFISFFLEILSIGLIFPIMSLILDKNFLSEYTSLTQFILDFSPFKSFSESEHFQLTATFILLFVVINFCEESDNNLCKFL
jgi:hypothetical protein